jgi:FKBP-type peptidyl-prolyl cis-trans isomerase FkpA
MMIKKTAIAMVLAATVLFACNAGGKTEAADGTTPAGSAGGDPDASYAFGVFMGKDLKQFGSLALDYDQFLEGFKDSLEGRESRIPDEEAYTLIQIAITEAMTRQADDNRRQETEFFAANGQKSGVFSTASGLQYEVITEGDGPRPGINDTVSVNYEGTFLDGTTFDNSYDRGEPVEFPLNGVISGWAEGIQLMRTGSTYRLFIPSALGYGEQGAGQGAIPPNAALIFRVELLSINPNPQN